MGRDQARDLVKGKGKGKGKAGSSSGSRSAREGRPRPRWVKQLFGLGKEMTRAKLYEWWTQLMLAPTRDMVEDQKVTHEQVIKKLATFKLDVPEEDSLADDKDDDNNLM